MVRTSYIPLDDDDFPYRPTHFIGFL